MRIVSFVDKEGSAIDRLVRMNTLRMRHLRIAHIRFHPKRPTEAQIDAARKAISQADLLDFQYWKTAIAVLKMFPEAARIPSILTHHNEHNVVGDWEWEKYKWSAMVVKNKWQEQRLKEKNYRPRLIRHAIEFDNFSFIPKLSQEKKVLYVGQIKKVKGVRELKKACDDLGYRLVVVGGVSEAGYWQELNKDGAMWLNNVGDDAINKIYHSARVYCANSDDGTESGTLPILEAMAAGIPVVTRRIGLVRDCGNNNKNMIVRDGAYTDVEDLKKSLALVMENEDVANELRENAWRTVRQYHPEVQAREYNRLFHQVLFPGEPIVSIIIPTFNRAQILAEQLASIKEQTYKNFEVVVCDDGSTDNTYNVVDEARKLYGYPIKYINTKDEKKYGLAKARNLGLIEAIGDIVVLCDDRLKMHPEAIGAFVKKLKELGERAWVWGSKGKFKTFVENFSATWRRTLIDGGMFNERIDEYGGMTQEISSRFGRQKIDFVFCPTALATPMIGTHSKSGNRESIINSKIKLYKMGFQ